LWRLLLRPPAGFLKDEIYAPGTSFDTGPWPDFNPLFPVSRSHRLVIPPSPFHFHSSKPRLPRNFPVEQSLPKEITVTPLLNTLLWATAAHGGRRRCSPPRITMLLHHRACWPTAVRGDPGDRYHKTGRHAVAQLSDQQSAVVARYPYWPNPNNVYPGFPAGQTLGAWPCGPSRSGNGIPPFLGRPWETLVRLPADQRATSAFCTA